MFIKTKDWFAYNVRLKKIIFSQYNCFCVRFCNQIALSHLTQKPSIKSANMVERHFLYNATINAGVTLGIIHVILAWIEIGRSAIFGREIEVPDREVFSRRKKNQF